MTTKAKEKSLLTITIGGDPEFGLRNKISKQQVYARQFYSGSHVGTDGHSDIGELRTSGGYTNPLLYVAELCNLINTTMNQKTPLEVMVTGGSMIENDPIGGHIHIGCKEGAQFLRERIQSVGDSLDLFVALPSLMIEDYGKSSYRRSHSGYGKLSATKETSWGIEYRTLPSWLVSKGFASSFLSLAYVVADHALNCEQPPVFSDLGEKAKKEFYKSNRKYFYRYLPKIFKYMKKMRLYKDYALPINSLFGFIKCFNFVPLRMWTAGKDFFPKWGVELKKATAPTSSETFDIAYSTTTVQMAEIVRFVTNDLKWKLDRKISFYGIPDGECDYDEDAALVFTGFNSDRINEIMESSDDSYSWDTTTRSHIPRKYQNTSLSIGIRRYLRRDSYGLDWVKHFLRELITPYLCRTAKGGAHYSSVFDLDTQEFVWA